MHVFRSVYFVFVCVLCICGVRVGGVIPAEHLGCWPRGGALAWEATKGCWLFFLICAEVWPQCCFFHFCGSKKRSLQTTPGYARLLFLKDYSCVSELPVTADQYNTDLSRVRVALPV